MEIKSISDQNLVAFLLTLNFKVLSIPKCSVKFPIFEFEDTPELRQACRDFFDHAKIEALAFAQNIRAIKAMVRELGR